MSAGRRSARSTKGKSPARLGDGDGWADSNASSWTGDDHKEADNTDSDTPKKRTSTKRTNNEQPPEASVLSSPESLGSVGIIVLLVVTLLNVFVLAYTVMAALGIDEVKGTSSVYMAAMFALFGAGIPMYQHVNWLAGAGGSSSA